MSSSSKETSPQRCQGCKKREHPALPDACCATVAEAQGWAADRHPLAKPILEARKPLKIAFIACKWQLQEGQQPCAGSLSCRSKRYELKLLPPVLRWICASTGVLIGAVHLHMSKVITTEPS